MKIRLLTIGLVALVLAPAAIADAVYHTERLELRRLAATSGGGAIVNIHANGPQVYAHEIYTLKGALPGKTYEVNLWVYPFAPSCSGAGVFFGSTQLTTNVAGNGQADRFFEPGIPPPLIGHTHGVKWTVTLNGVPQYETRCTQVTLD